MKIEAKNLTSGTRVWVNGVARMVSSVVGSDVWVTITWTSGDATATRATKTYETV